MTIATVFEQRACAVCGCTETSACVDDLRGPCSWVSEALCSHCAEPDPRASVATLAATSIADALAEVLRFAREGNALPAHPFGEAEPVGKLAEALLRIARVELTAYEAPAWKAERETLGQLVGALHKFTEEWLG